MSSVNSHMHRATLLLIALSTSTVAADTRVTLTGAADGAEVCRFQARDAEKPIDRWLAPHELTCVAADSALTFPPGLWNVFARSRGAVSVQPIVVDGSVAPSTLAINLVPAATLLPQLPPGARGILYAPRHVIAYPATERTSVPAAEELWLIVTAQSGAMAVIPVAPLAAAVDRAVDARSIADTPALLGWIHMSETDRAAVKTARGVEIPRIALSAGQESLAASLPDPEFLSGAFVLFRGVRGGSGDLRLSGRGWLPFQRAVQIAPQNLTLLREPIQARASATVIVNWSVNNDLFALDRSLGSCGPRKEEKLEITISSCPEPVPGKSLDSASCSPIHKETPRNDLTFGSVRVDEVTPGLYRAELRFGRLPPVSVVSDVPPLQQGAFPLQAQYFEMYGSLTRGGAPLADDAEIAFPSDGVGFSPRQSGEYHAVVKASFGIDGLIGIVTCNGKHSFVLTDRPIETWRRARFDIDIPDNSLTVTAIDTFTRTLLPAATLKVTIMSLRMPRRPVLTREITQSEAGKFVMEGVPERELRLTLSSPGYKRKDVDPFSMTKSEKKEIEVELVPLGGSEARIGSSRPFVNGAIYWFSATGVETERADLAPDGTFHFEQTHYRDETMSVVSLSHPMWILRAPTVERATPLQLRFPDNMPSRDVEVVVANVGPRMLTPIGVAIGGLRVPQPVLVQHLALRGSAPIAKGNTPLLLPALAETAPIDIHRASSGIALQPQFMEALLQRTFVPVATQRLEAGSTRVTLP